MGGAEGIEPREPLLTRRRLGPLALLLRAGVIGATTILLISFGGQLFLPPLVVAHWFLARRSGPAATSGWAALATVSGVAFGGVLGSALALPVLAIALMLLAVLFTPPAFFVLPRRLEARQGHGSPPRASAQKTE